MPPGSRFPKARRSCRAFDIRAGASGGPTRAAGARLPRRGAGQDPHRPAQAEGRDGRGSDRPNRPRRRDPVRSPVGGHPADPPRGRNHLLSPADPRSRGRDRRCPAPGVLRVHGRQRRRRPGPLPLARAERVPRRRARRRQDGSTKSHEASISCCRSRRSTAARRWSASSPMARQEAPKFRYRPLTVDPDAAKRDLYAVDLSIIEDPLLERLLSEKRQEIDHQLTMLSTRNTAAFKAASLLHYGTVGSQLLADAQAILARPKPRKPCGRRGRRAGGRRRGARAGRQISGGRQALRRRHRSARRCRQPAGFGRQADDREQHGNAAVTRRRAASHEVSVHLLTHFNGAAQGLTVFRTGLAHYEGVQEGLGVFAEWAVGGLSAGAAAAARRARGRGRCDARRRRASSTSIAASPMATACRASPRSTSRPACSGRAASPRTSSI